MFKPFGKKAKSTKIQALHGPTGEQLNTYAGIPNVGKGPSVWPKPPHLKPVVFKKPPRRI